MCLPKKPGKAGRNHRVRSAEKERGKLIVFGRTITLFLQKHCFDVAGFAPPADFFFEDE